MKRHLAYLAIFALLLVGYHQSIFSVSGPRITNAQIDQEGGIDAPPSDGSLAGTLGVSQDPDEATDRGEDDGAVIAPGGSTGDTEDDGLGGGKFSTGRTGDGSGSGSSGGKFSTGRTGGSTGGGSGSGSNTGGSSTPPPVVPVVYTGPALNIGETYATLTGTVITPSSPADVWFEFSNFSLLSQSTDAARVSALPGSQSVSRYLSSLNPGGFYYYKMCARNAAGTACGALLSFRTQKINEQVLSGAPTKTPVPQPEKVVVRTKAPEPKGEVAGTDDTLPAYAGESANIWGIILQALLIAIALILAVILARKIMGRKQY